MKKFFTPFFIPIAIFTIVTIGGGAVVYTKIGLTEIPPFSFTFLRFALASICILPFFLKDPPKLQKNFYKVILFSLILSYNIIFFIFGIKFTTATVSGMLYAAMPILVAVLSFFLLAQKLHARKIFGIILGFAGVITIVLLPTLTKGSPLTGNLTGNLIIVTTVMATAFYNTLSKKFQKQYTPMQLTSIFIFTTTFVLMLLAGTDLIISPSWWKHVPLHTFGEIGFVGLGGTVIYYVLTQYVIKRGSPLIASLMFYIQPITTFIWAYFLLGEQITLGVVFGAILTFFGVFLILKKSN